MLAFLKRRLVQIKWIPLFFFHCYLLTVLYFPLSVLKTHVYFITYFLNCWAMSLIVLVIFVSVFEIQCVDFFCVLDAINVFIQLVLCIFIIHPLAKGIYTDRDVCPSIHIHLFVPFCLCIRSGWKLIWFKNMYWHWKDNIQNSNCYYVILKM